MQGGAGILGALGLWRPNMASVLSSPPNIHQPALGMVGGVAGPSDFLERHKRFNDAMTGPSRANRRRELTRALMDGVPPHLAGMRSNAPWFTAQRAAAFLEAEEYAQRSFLDRMRAEILGELF